MNTDIKASLFVPGFPVPGHCEHTLKGLAALWEEPATYVKQFAEAMQSVTQGYFLSYFTEKCMPGEWISLNNDIVFDEAGLTPKQWRNIRQQLMAKGLLLNRRTVFPTDSLFTLDDLLLERTIREHSTRDMTAIGGPPVSINKLHLKTLAGLGLSFKSVLYLSFLQNETGYVAFQDRGEWSPWTCMAEGHVTEMTVLSRREQETAIAELGKVGLLEIKLEGMPATRSGRYSLKMLGTLTAQYLNRT
ncbi:hypothetical protein [Neisseria yangbaofengii]|uniref:hypothetical protein n=1 Tax=Neisseria yangbaofengii TaxID=2709396 RepID=UPI0013ECD729|nr:hypothetical protein [Neisseria yangbaofengii]